MSFEPHTIIPKLRMALTLMVGIGRLFRYLYKQIDNISNYNKFDIIFLIFFSVGAFHNLKDYSKLLMKRQLRPETNKDESADFIP